MERELDRLDRRDPELIASLQPAVELFNQHYLSLQADGLDNVVDGPALLVGNHNGGIAGPDLACTLGTLWNLRGPHAPLYALAHDFAMRQFRPFGRVLQKFGALRASTHNAHCALAHGGQVLVYPGGDLDAYRHSRLRDRVVFGPRSGFVRVAQAAGVPIVPIVTQGAHRSAYIFHEGEFLARRMGLPRWARLERFPFALALPWGIAVGPWVPYLPLPFPIRLRVLPAMHVSPDDDVMDAREQIRSAMQRALDDLRELR